MKISKWSLLLVSLIVLGLSYVPHVLSQSDDVLNVWFVPHSHDDVGWLKTIEEYYEQQVRYIYNTVVEELQKRADRKFIIVEMAFFSMWWAEATESQKELVRGYVRDKKVEFVLGGWCMNDDADPTYSATINQMTEGHRFIYDTFGVVPRYGWHIDPFGLSSYLATLYAKMGFNAHIINRIHYQLKDDWKAERHLEFVWRGSDSLGSETDMFTHVLDSHYSFPSGFDFERDSPISEFNIESRVNSLVSELKRRSNWYLAKHLFVTGGDDFRWQNAKVQYDNWDKIIDYINERTSTYGVRIQYATLDDYFQALNKENVDWPVFHDDFFPYADNYDSYWTGFYTTHSGLKGLIRESSSELRATEILALDASFSNPSQEFKGDPHLVEPLRWASAEAQHHDGVTGTSKIKVIDMYDQHLTDGIDQSRQLLIESVNHLISGSSLQNSSQISFKPKSVDSILKESQQKQAAVVPLIVTNTLGWTLTTFHRIPVNSTNYVVMDENGFMVKSQILATKVSETETSYELFYEATVPPAGINTYYLTEGVGNYVKPISLVSGQTVTLENDVYQINATESSSSILLVITNKQDGSTFRVTEEIMEYLSYTGSGQKSGAYIFKPAGAAKRVTGFTELSFTNGPYVQELVHVIDGRHAQSFRLYKSKGIFNENTFEHQFKIGPLNPDAECVVRFTTDIPNTILYTDDNGADMHARRPTSGPIQENYYPMVAQSFLSNSKNQFTVLTERTMGASSPQVGQFEAMLHRRCSRDDGRGMGEALDDTTTVYPTLQLIFATSSTSEHIRPRARVMHQYSQFTLFGNPVSTISEWKINYRTSFSGLQSDLPENVHLLSFKVITKSNWNSAILRLQNIYEKDSDPQLSLPVEVSLDSLFSTSYKVSEELELSGILPMSQMNRLQWQNHEEDFSWVNFFDHVHEMIQRRDQRYIVELYPTQIRTFQVDFI